MLKIVAADTAIENPMDAVSKLNKYNGMDVSLGIQGELYPITLIRTEATGKSNRDELRLEFLWGQSIEDSHFASLYKELRSSINNVLRLKVGKEEFFGVLADTTKAEPGISLEDLKNHKYYLVFNNVHSYTNKEAGAHKTSIVEVLVPDSIWAQIQKDVPGAKDLDDPPHITLCYIPEISKKEADSIKEVLASICENTAPFQVNVEKVSCFKNGKDKIPHIGVIKSLDLVKFRDKVSEAIAEIDPDFIDNSFPDFKPHLTLQYADADEPLPKIKPISWVVREISFSFKGNDKTVYPLNLVNNMQGVSVKAAEVYDNNSLLALAEKIRDSLDAFGYEEEANKIKEASEVLAKKKKKKKKDDSVTIFTTKLRNQLSRFIDTHQLDNATDEVLQLLMDDNNSEPAGTGSTPVDTGDVGGAGDMGGGDAGGGDAGASVEALGPHMEGVDPHIMVRVKGVQTQNDSTGLPMKNKGVPFMERNYATELRNWLKDNA